MTGCAGGLSGGLWAALRRAAGPRARAFVLDALGFDARAARAPARSSPGRAGWIASRCSASWSARWRRAAARAGSRATRSSGQRARPLRAAHPRPGQRRRGGDAERDRSARRGGWRARLHAESAAVASPPRAPPPPQPARPPPRPAARGRGGSGLVRDRGGGAAGARRAAHDAAGAHRRAGGEMASARENQRYLPGVELPARAACGGRLRRPVAGRLRVPRRPLPRAWTR